MLDIEDKTVEQVLSHYSDEEIERITKLCEEYKEDVDLLIEIVCEVINNAKENKIC